MTFDRLRTYLLFVAIAVAAALMPAQNDLWWHLRAGREMWRAHALLTVDTFSHTAAGAAWPNHEWLFELLLYPLYVAGGVRLVTLVCAAAAVGAWAVVWPRIPAPPRIRFFLVAGVLLSAVGTWTPRPQVFSLLLLAATMAALRQRRYAWLPPIFLFWANLHGAVVLGGVVVAAAVAVAPFESRAHARRLAMFAALAAAATLATPMGIHFWTAIVRSLGRIRLLGIDEWAAPRPLDPAMAPFWIAAIAFVSLVALRGRQLIRDRAALQAGHLTQCACALALLTPAVSAVRNVPPFLLAAVPAIAALAGFTAPGTGTIETSVAATTTAPRANVMLATVATAVALLVVVLSYTHPPLRLHWDPLPASSIAALDRCPGNLYNRYDEGGYLIWFAPEHPVFLDGRQDPYPPSLIEDQRRVERTGNYEDVFRRYGIGCAFVPADSIVASRLLDAGWRPLYDASPWKVLAR